MKTHGINKIEKAQIRINYSNFYEKFYQTFEWYKKNKIYKL